MRSSLRSAVPVWTIARRQALDRLRGADPHIARAGPRRGGRGERDRARHGPGEAMDQPAVVFVPGRVERRKRRAGRFRCQSPPAAMPMSASTTRPHCCHRRHQPVRGLQRAEGDGQVEHAGPALSIGAAVAVDPARQVAGDAHARARPARRISCSETCASRPRLRPVPNKASIRTGAASVSPKRFDLAVPVSARRLAASLAARRAPPPAPRPRAPPGAAPRHSRRRHYCPARHRTSAGIGPAKR